MPVYEIRAIDQDRNVTVVATTDMATAALVKFRDALPRYRRTWVSDESGSDVSHEELMARSNCERQ